MAGNTDIDETVGIGGAAATASDGRLLIGGSTGFSTTAFEVEKFLVGAAAISALPPLNGFVSEWLTFQAILLSPQLPQWTLKLMVPITLAPRHS